MHDRSTEPKPTTRERYCCDRCHEEDNSKGVHSRYSPCPLLGFDSRSYQPEELCLHCGWLIPVTTAR